MTRNLVSLTRDGAAFDSEEDVEATIDATLSALGASISTGEKRDVAEFLPGRFADAFLSSGTAEPEPLSYDEFLGRVADDLDVTEERAERRVRAVMAALAQVVGEPELGDARAQLPPEYGRAFETAGGLTDESFGAAVADATDLSEPESSAAARATLETLSERLTRGESEDLAHYLRGAANRWILSGDADAEAFPPEEFVSRVAARAEVDEDRAREYVDAVATTLAGVVPDRELERAAAQLPDSYDALLAPATTV
ncbi:DUF2267 domain-containing protein [Halobaculum sp. D14]|uniref:DUF2267 domain-containing protein n=1 Tax=Halobaculum sp. D14 TaxID=3421642 RepID=UPI003EBD351F